MKQPKLKTYWVTKNHLKEATSFYKDFDDEQRRKLDCFQVLKLSDLETFAKSFIKTFDNQRASIELALDEKQEWANKEDRKKLDKYDKLRLQDQKNVFDCVFGEFEKQFKRLGL